MFPNAVLSIYVVLRAASKLAESGKEARIGANLAAPASLMLGVPVRRRGIFEVETVTSSILETARNPTLLKISWLVTCKLCAIAKSIKNLLYGMLFASLFILNRELYRSPH